MEEIKSWLKDHKILPRISFKDRQAHIVEILKARAESFTNDKDEFVEGMKFLVNENGEFKTFFTASQDLLLKLADCQEKEVYKIKMCAKNTGGIIRTSYEVSKIEGENEVQIDENANIPIIENEETEPTQEELKRIFPEHKEKDKK